MNNFTQKENDNKIREALKIADKKNQLDVVAAVVGIAGGAKRLKEIMNSTEDLHIMDRGMLSIHLVI